MKLRFLLSKWQSHTPQYRARNRYLDHHQTRIQSLFMCFWVGIVPSHETRAPQPNPQFSLSPKRRK